MPISDFQSQFSMSKIVRIFLIFFIEEYQLRGMCLLLTFFENLNFYSTLFTKIISIFGSMNLEQTLIYQNFYEKVLFSTQLS